MNNTPEAHGAHEEAVDSRTESASTTNTGFMRGLRSGVANLAVAVALATGATACAPMNQNVRSGSKVDKIDAGYDSAGQHYANAKEHERLMNLEYDVAEGELTAAEVLDCPGAIEVEVKMTDAGCFVPSDISSYGTPPAGYDLSASSNSVEFTFPCGKGKPAKRSLYRDTILKGTKGKAGVYYFQFSASGIKQFAPAK